MKPSYEDNSIQFVSKPFRILDKKKTELAKIGKFMPSCTIKVCVLALRNRIPGNEWSFLSGRTSRGFHKHANNYFELDYYKTQFRRWLQDQFNCHSPRVHML